MAKTNRRPLVLAFAPFRYDKGKPPMQSTVFQVLMKATMKKQLLPIGVNLAPITFDAKEPELYPVISGLQAITGIAHARQGSD